MNQMDTSMSMNHELINNIVAEFKAQGVFDQFRKDCIADVDTKPAFQNLKSRVEGEVKFFLDKQTWKPGMNKNQMRESLRKYINDASYLKLGLEKIVDQVVNPNIYTVFMPRVRDVVNDYLSIKRPKEDYELKDLLPENLEPISPNSDKGLMIDLGPQEQNTPPDKSVNEVFAEKAEKKSPDDLKDNPESSASKDTKKSSASSRRLSSGTSRNSRSHKRTDGRKSSANSKNYLKSERSSDRSSDRSLENKKSRDKKSSRSSEHRRKSPSGKRSSDTDTSKSRSRSRKRRNSESKASDDSSRKKVKTENNSESSRDAEKDSLDTDFTTLPDEERVQIVSGDESFGSSPKSDTSMTLEDTKKMIFNTSLPDEERVQIVSDEDNSQDGNSKPTMTLEETTKIIFG